MEQNNQGQFVPPYKGGPISTWARGMTNRRSDVDIPADLLLLGVNVDVTPSGRLQRRRGISQVIADSNAHSVFGSETRMYWATPTTLKSCDVNFTPTTHLTSPLLANPVWYLEHQGVVYFSNEQINGKIINGVYQPWGIVPPTAPTVTGQIATITDPINVFLQSLKTPRQTQITRNYAVTCTFVIKVNGVEIEESGAPGGVLGVSDDSGYLAISNIPQSTDSRVTHVRIYVADMNGKAYFQAVDLPVGVTSYALRRPYTLGKQLTSQFLTNPPCGQLIEHRYGRIYIAADNILYFTDPLRYGGVHAHHGFLMFPERITLLIAVEDGLYVSSDETYFLQGTPEQGKITQQKVLPYKAIEGSQAHFPNSNDVVWRSERGIVIGKAGGSVKNVTEDQIAIDVVSRAALGFIEANGTKRIVTIAKDSTDNPLAHEDYIAAEQAFKDEKL